MTYCVADEVLGRFARQQHDWFERVRKGSLNPEEVMGAVQAVINRGALLLAPHEYSTAGPVASHNPHEFFKTRSGLFMWDGFVDWVLSVVGEEVSLDKEVTLSSFTLTKNAADARIRENLPEDHVFEASELCAILAHMIDAQPNGKEGHLLTNGYANLFYVRGNDGWVCVVSVYWFSDSRRWNVGAWDLDGFAWNSDYRIFSRNC